MIRPIILIALLIAVTGCNQMMAEHFSAAPNLGSPQRGVDAPADVLAGHSVSRQLRVNVGPPAASLSVWVIEPEYGRMAMFSIAGGAKPDEKFSFMVSPDFPSPPSPRFPTTFPVRVPLGTIFFSARPRARQREHGQQFLLAAAGQDGVSGGAGRPARARPINR